MKKIQTLTLIIIAHLIYLPDNIAYSNPLKKNTWYIGNKIGLPRYNNIITYINEIITCNNTNEEICNSHIGFGTFIGYHTDQCFGFELGYNWLGQITYSNEEIKSSFEVQNIDISTKLYHPIIHDSINIYTKIGGAIWHASIKNSYHDHTNKIHHLNINDTSISPLLSFGIEYTIKKQWTTRLEYQKINNVGNIHSIGAQSNHTMINLNILYYFI
ncbi:outer membrane beta-barrel protein [Blochmannia endosymbiont of Polyrhachis (Hedomyrma) turneri]|uniref:outer membrane beta-barrel protein n=1 Tax=Blochmannia endosymbiont of Polyrhachis (Hedomyrma) turneri TaxID=1505596 RepID=UPI00061A831C|nr:outer membrane beta-barrel protein [Blochmannia endosymbiont of Polyrhachis (Hedomyrma) turneri]AKC59980.1 Outer membrane protein A [Blochmannia endosymbiont of Polyrhachis (Hedomyrma) turneri]